LVVRQPQAEHSNDVAVADLGMLGTYSLVLTLARSGGAARRAA
jgi:hypothetical protein